MYTVTGPKDADGMANSVDTDQTLGAVSSGSTPRRNLIWVYRYTVCPDLFVRKLRNIMLSGRTDRTDLEEQSDRGLHCLQLRLHLLYA